MKREELIDAFINKVWITRKCRINAEARLERCDFLVGLLILYYSLIILFLSVWSLIEQLGNHRLGLIAVIASIGLFGAQLFLSSRNFKLRSFQMKDCYIKLDEIYMQLQLLRILSSEQTVENQLTQIQSRYNNILNAVENHTDYDFLNISENLNWSQKVKLYCHKILIFVTFMAAFVAPFIVNYLIFRIGDS